MYIDEYHKQFRFVAQEYRSIFSITETFHFEIFTLI